jgi:hypothetical protein
MFQPSDFKDERRLEDWPLLRPNPDRHVLSFIKWRELLGQTRRSLRVIARSKGN